MPVQINEVIIRATVNDGPCSSGSNTTASPAENMLDNATLVEQIMDIIRNKNER
jgi:hypothetical protein